MTWPGSYRAAPNYQNFTANTVFAVTAASGIVAGDQILLWFNTGPAYGYTGTCPGFASFPITWGSLLTRKADGTEGSTFTVTASASCTPSVVQAVIAGPCSIDVMGLSGGAN